MRIETFGDWQGTLDVEERKDDLLIILIQGVEGVEKLLLRRLPAGDELDIVHEEKIGLAVFLAEFNVFARLDGADELVREVVALYVDD